MSAGTYSLERDGLYYIPALTKEAADEQEADPIWLCSPLQVVSLAQDEDGVWGKLIEYADPNGKLASWVMPAALLASPKDLWSALLARGVKLAYAKGGLEALRVYLNHETPAKRARLVSRLGWYVDGANTVFVRPDAVIGGGNAEAPTILYQNGQTHSPFEIRGTVEDWITNIGRLCVGNSRLILAASAAFAAPTLFCVGEESGGINFQGGSRTGKTTTLYAGGSVGGSHGMVVLWRATSNGLEAVCEERCDGLLCLDEMGQVDAKEAGEIAYMIANGKGKQRMTRTTSLQRVKEWRVLFLSSGEISLADKMSEIGKKPRAGQQVELLNVPADAGARMGVFENLHGAQSPGAFAEQLRRATLDTYGAPLAEFLNRIAKALADDEAAVRSDLRQLRDNFIHDHLPEGASGQVRTACGRFGLIAAAGELATKFGLTGWPDDEATTAAIKCFQAWLGKRGSTGDHDVEVAIRQVTAYVEQHHSRFENVEDEISTVHNRVGLRHNENGVWHYYVLPEAWQNELCRGYDAKAVAKEMIQRGLLQPDRNGGSSTSKRFPRYGQMRVYRLAPGIVGGAHPDTRTQAQHREDFIHRMMSDDTAVGVLCDETVGETGETATKQRLH